MPIRMVDDDNQNEQEDNSTPSGGSGGSGGGGGFGGGNMIMMLLPFLIRNPKLLILVLIVGGGYFFLGRGCHSPLSSSSVASAFKTGGVLDQQQFDKAEVFEALADNAQNPLPERVSLEQYAPARRNQGSQGSCVAWASAYAARTILRARQTGENPNDIAFSPAFVYNQIKLSQDCQGSYIVKAVETMTQEGALPLSQFPYTDQSCDRRPTRDDIAAAEQYKMKGANRLTKGGDDYALDMLAIKQNLAHGAPVVIGMMVGGSFMQDMMGKKMWIPSQDDYEMAGFGGHAMCVIGYDDFIEGGAFQIMNSWGTDWGDNGIAWVRYKDFKTFVKEAYGTYPMGSVQQPVSTLLDVKIGLLNTGTNKLINLQQKGDNVFETSTPIHVGEKFKMEVTNTLECYTYIFGQETDGSSYVLFPYTAKHSPYCGVTGTRVFPKDKSMQADDKGSKDLMAIVVTKTPIDFKAMNETINKGKGSYADKLNSALADIQIEGVKYTGSDHIAIHCDPKGKNAVGIVVEIDKVK
jgi:C1A family cysteine protease